MKRDGPGVADRDPALPVGWGDFGDSERQPHASGGVDLGIKSGQEVDQTRRLAEKVGVVGGGNA